jgi:site-specific recombinase XerD
MPTRPKVPLSPSLLSLEPDWRREMDAHHVSPNTQRSYLQRLAGFCGWLAPDGEAAHCTSRIADIDRPTITSFFGWLYANKATNTVLNYHIALKQFFDLAIEYGDLEEGHNPIRWIERPKPKIDPPAIPTDDEIKRLLATCERGKDFKSRRDYAILRTFLSTGVRLQELCLMELDDVRLEEGLIHVQHAKGGRPRTVAIGVRTVRAIGVYRHLRDRHNHGDLPQLWLSQRGAISHQTVYNMIVSRANAAGIVHVHPHLMRHWFAHGYLAGGGQESSLLQLAGWRDSKMLRERYGAALASERAVVEHHRLNIGEKW